MAGGVCGCRRISSFRTDSGIPGPASVATIRNTEKIYILVFGIARASCPPASPCTRRSDPCSAGSHLPASPWAASAAFPEPLPAAIPIGVLEALGGYYMHVLISCPCFKLSGRCFAIARGLMDCEDGCGAYMGL